MIPRIGFIMKKINKFIFLISSLGLGIFIMSSALNTFATGNTNVNICHCSQGVCTTKSVSPASATKHLTQHEGDYEGVCKEITPTPTPTIEITPTPTITEPTPTPAPTETPTPTLTPVPPTQAPGVGGGHVSDGRSDGKTDSLGCINTDCSNQGGQVLGISTGVLGLATTGSYEAIAKVILSGFLLLSTGSLLRFRKGR